MLWFWCFLFSFYFSFRFLLYRFFCRPFLAGNFASRKSGPLASAELGPGIVDRRQHLLPAHHRLRHFVVSWRYRRGDIRSDLAIGLSIQLHRRRFHQFHVELFPGRPRLCIRPDPWHFRTVFRLGFVVRNRQVSASFFFDVFVRLYTGFAERSFLSAF